MLRSLSSRLLLAFAFIIVLSLGLSAIGTVLLLRDQQRDAAEERVGRLVQPITLAIALLDEAGVSDVEIQNAVDDYARAFDVRILLVDEESRVVVDSDSRLDGESVEEPGLSVTRRGSATFRMTKYGADGEDLLLFAPAQESVQLSSSRLLELQTLIYEVHASSRPPEELEELLASLPLDTEVPRVLPPPSLRPLVAVSESEITSAWRDVIPQLTIAGAIALAASVVVAVLISRSISGRLRRVTLAAQEMSRGNYNQQLDPRGEDEVGRLARAFNVMARQVSGSHRMMRDFLANISHELKTPLTSIQGFSQALEEDAIGSPEEYREAGRIINEETQRMRQLVEDLIALSRLESGQALVQRGRVDLDDLLRTCAGRFDWQLRDANAGLTLELASRLPVIEGDARHLEQAFSNLIDNAVRHAPSGGAITVRAETEDSIVRVAVHNTGSYIPSDELPRVFERFYQLDRSRTAGVGGSGLGLAIASEVVQAHDGSITATSDRERGTEFIVTLPLASSRQGP